MGSELSLWQLDSEEQIRRCTRCRKVKAFSEFRSDDRMRYGRSSWCRSCANEKTREYKAANRDEIQAKRAKYRAENRRMLADDIASRRASNPDHFMKRRHGITMDQHQEFIDRQGGRCAICRKEFCDTRRPVVDHDHDCCPVKKNAGGDARRSCGKCIRGMLCDKCNRALGSFDDDIEILTSAVDYLRKWKGNPMAMVSYYDGGAEVPAPGGDYSAPTAHAAHSSHDIFVAPTSVPSGGEAPAVSAGFDCMDGLGEATSL